MEKVISVLIADSSDDFLTLISDSIRNESDVFISGVAQDGEETLELAYRLKPDVLVTEILLRRLDGIGVLRRLKESGSMPHVIVVSAFFNDSIASEISRLGADYCFPKPCRVQELVSRIRECVPELGSLPGRQSGYDNEIAQALISFGVMPHLQGYRYLREGIKRSIEDRGVLHGVTKILYPDLAKTFHTNPKCIERSMRNAVETAWKNGDFEKRAQYFGQCTSQLEERPTNSHFMAMITEFILMQESQNDNKRVMTAR